MPSVRFLPFAVSQISCGIYNPPVGGNQQADSQLGDCVGIFARTVGNVNPAAAGGVKINRVDAGPGANYQREQWRGFYRFRAYFGRTHNQDFRIRKVLR